MYAKLAPEEADAIERRLLIEMAARYGALREKKEAERIEGKSRAIRTAKENLKGEIVA